MMRTTNSASAGVELVQRTGLTSWHAFMRASMSLLLVAVVLTLALPGQAAFAQEARQQVAPAELNTATLLGHVQQLVQQSNDRDLKSMGLETAMKTLAAEDREIRTLRGRFCSNQQHSASRVESVEKSCRLLAAHSQMNALRQFTTDLLLSEDATTVPVALALSGAAALKRGASLVGMR